MSIGLMSIIGTTPIFGRPNQSTFATDVDDRLGAAVVTATERVAAAQNSSSLRAAEIARTEAWILSERFGGTSSGREDIKAALESAPIRAPFGSTLAVQFDARRLLAAAFMALGREFRPAATSGVQPRLS